jgi:hypothetical protein
MLPNPKVCASRQADLLGSPGPTVIAPTAVIDPRAIGPLDSGADPVLRAIGPLDSGADPVLRAIGPLDSGADPVLRAIGPLGSGADLVPRAIGPLDSGADPDLREGLAVPAVGPAVPATVLVPVVLAMALDLAVPGTDPGLVARRGRLRLT